MATGNARRRRRSRSEDRKMSQRRNWSSVELVVFMMAVLFALVVTVSGLGRIRSALHGGQQNDDASAPANGESPVFHELNSEPGVSIIERLNRKITERYVPLVNAADTQEEPEEYVITADSFRDCLGTFTTDVSGSSGRKGNVKLAAELCDGTILMPGEEFSYNQTLGERTTERGFSEAPAYQGGETVQEVGGGICQTSSTLYIACLYANLQINERHCHSYEPGYVELGMDAAVSWNGPDYRFTNNTSSPIQIRGEYSDGQVTMGIYGVKSEDIRVEITSEILSTTEYSTKTRHDSSLAPGQSVVVTSPHNGYEVQTYRTIYDSTGEKISSQRESYSQYRVRDKVVAQG